MKIKLDFISNSSSTSFVFIQFNGNFTKEKFLETIGVDKDSPIAELFINFYYIIKDKITRGDKINSQQELEQYLESNSWKFLPETITRMEENIKAGQEIIMADFSTNDGNNFDSCLCMSSFEINSSDFLLSAYQDAY